MNRASYTGKDVQTSFRMCHDLASSAIRELDRGPERVAARDTLRRVLARIEAAGRALEAGDPTRAEGELADAGRLTTEALATAKPGEAAAPARNADLSLDLLDQTLGAIEMARHRVRNGSGRHTAFGAIRTPPSERCP